MDRKEHESLGRTLIFFLPLLLLLSACTTPEERISARDGGEGQVTLFLNGPEQTSLDVSFTITAVNIVTDDGTPRAVSEIPLEINSFEIKGRQVLLGEQAVPEGSYQSVELIIEQAEVRTGDRPASLALPPEGVSIPVTLHVKRRRNNTLFLNWNADASIKDGYLFDPSIVARGQLPELSTSLVYVTNEEADNVSVINRQTGEVVATVMTGKAPRGVAAVAGADRLKVFVVNSGSNSISVIDPTINKVENEILLRFGREPEAIAVAELSPAREFLFITNYSTNSVSVVDVSTFREVERIEVGQGPVAIAADPPVESLIGTRYLSVDDIAFLRRYRENFLHVYVANRESHDVSVLRINRKTARLDEVTTLNVEWNPMGLAVAYQRGKVYVANYGSDKLSVLNIVGIARGIRSGTVSTVNNIGDAVIDVIADPTLDRIYLLRERPAEVVIVRTFDELRERSRTTQLPPVMGTIPVGHSPRSFLLDPEGRKIYVVNRGANTVSVIDKTSQRLEQEIFVGSMPYGIALFPKLQRSPR